MGEGRGGGGGNRFILFSCLADKSKVRNSLYRYIFMLFTIFTMENIFFYFRFAFPG